MFIAGRIEVLGKHTDYCGGQSIVCAVDRGFTVDATPSEHVSLVVTDEVSGETLTIPFSENAAENAKGWAIYPATVAARVARNFGDELKSGVKISFRSNLPPAAGLSSSSALITAIFCAVAQQSGIADSSKYRRNIIVASDLVEYLGCIENGSSYKELDGTAGVGTFGGSQDHAAIVGSQAGRLFLAAFSPLIGRAICDIPEEFVFVIAASGVAAEKTGDAMEKYNRLSGIVRAVVAAWPEKGKSLAELVKENGVEKLVGFATDRNLGFDRDVVKNRLRQFYEESFEIIPAVWDLLAAGKIEEIGALVDRSQRNAEELLGNQTPETIFLQRRARELGAVAASAFGAGFGGSVYAIVPRSDVQSFKKAWRQSYAAKFPQPAKRAKFFAVETSQSRDFIPFRSAV